MKSLAHLNDMIVPVLEEFEIGLVFVQGHPLGDSSQLGNINFIFSKTQVSIAPCPSPYLRRCHLGLPPSLRTGLSRAHLHHRSPRQEKYQGNFKIIIFQRCVCRLQSFLTSSLPESSASPSTKSFLSLPPETISLLVYFHTLVFESNLNKSASTQNL